MDIRLNRVYDRAVFRHDRYKLVLTVDADPRRLTAELVTANERLHAANLAIEAGAEYGEAFRDAALGFATAIFGAEQAQQLLTFCVDVETLLAAVTRYFRDRLSQRILAAQRREARK
ncbi:MAG: hypothetical protein RSB91_03065 [Clostridia bacterium]